MIVSKKNYSDLNTLKELKRRKLIDSMYKNLYGFIFDNVVFIVKRLVFLSKKEINLQ